MADTPNAPAAESPAPAEPISPAEPTADSGADEPLITIPLDLVADSPGDNGGGAELSTASAAPQEDEIVITAARRQIAGEIAGLGLDGEGRGADVVDTGRELLLWTQSPSASSVAVLPDIDMSDPEDWLDALARMDWPAPLEAQIEQLAHAAIEAGDTIVARRKFMAALAGLMARAGVETLAVRKPGSGESGDSGTFDWITLSPDDMARARDHAPWAPEGGDDGITLRPIGVALGLGGRLRLWPRGPGPAPKIDVENAGG